MIERTLNYEEVLDWYAHHHTVDGDLQKLDAYFVHQAQNMHSLNVSDSLRDLYADTAFAANTLKNQQAKYYLLYGASRRLEMIWHAYRKIIYGMPPDRIDPLIEEEPREFTQDLNVIYMNLRGVLDNFAWSLLFEFEPEQASKISKAKVSLFGGCILKNNLFEKLKPFLQRKQSWDKEVKMLRDPVAHRIPLYVPPQNLTMEESVKWQELSQEHSEKFSLLDFEGIDRLNESMESLGTFCPIFMHNPEDGFKPIYPTIPKDMAHLVETGRAVLEFLSPKAE